VQAQFRPLLEKNIPECAEFSLAVQARQPGHSCPYVTVAATTTASEKVSGLVYFLTEMALTPHPPLCRFPTGANIFSGIVV
jgi:hypothetical protein